MAKFKFTGFVNLPSKDVASLEAMPACIDILKRSKKGLWECRSHHFIEHIGSPISCPKCSLNKSVKKFFATKWKSVNDLPPPPDNEFAEDEIRCVVVWQDQENPHDLGVDTTTLHLIREGDYSDERREGAVWRSVMDAPPCRAVEKYMEEVNDE